jgi:predicted nucleic acid-binding protein
MAEPAWMLATNALSELIRNPRGPLSRRLAGLEPDAVCSSMIVACDCASGRHTHRQPRFADRRPCPLARAGAGDA